ncbi:MAG: diguanylate cyclase [Frankiaceae bacterium]
MGGSAVKRDADDIDMREREHAEARGVRKAPALSATPTPLGAAATEASDPPVRQAATAAAGSGSAQKRCGGRGVRRRFPRRVGWPLRVLLLVAAVMLLLTLPVVFVLPALHRVDDESARLQTMAADASELGAATTANADGQAALLAFITSTSPTERAALLNRSVERAQYTRSVQEKLAATAGSDPATRALWTQLHADWETATAVSTTLAGTLMNSRPTRATGAAISRQLAAYGAVSDDLTALAGEYQKTVTGLSADVRAYAREARSRLLIVYVGTAGVLLALLVAGLPFARRWARQERQRDRLSKRTEAEARLQRAYEMTESEPEAIAVTRRALRELLGRFDARLQLADSSHAHLSTLIDTAPQASACAPASPGQCPAAALGQPRTFSDSSALDACPRLSVSMPAVTCAPVSVAGRSVGTVQLLAPDCFAPTALDDDTAATLLLIARRLGDRLTMLRAFARSERQARTDPLTGLLNRRSLEEQLDAVTLRGISYSVAFIDLDRFKMLNDTHGHAAGDRALQLFSGVLRRRVRPDDLIGRWGGEEFIVVFPQTDRATAFSVMDRIRVDLVDTIASSGTPAFTISCGIAGSTDGETFHEVIRYADQALLAAKSSGRDRITDYEALV